MPITLDQLAPFLTDPRIAQRGAQEAAGNYIESLRQNNRLNEQAREHDTTLTSEEQRAKAALDELTRYHGASVDLQQQGIDAATQERQANAIKAVTDAVSSGNFVQAKALMPYLQALGVNAREMGGASPSLPTAPSTQLTDPNAPPPTLAAFADMPQLSAPMLSAPEPAPAGPSGVYGFHVGDKELGQLDLNQLSAEQRAQAQPLFAAMLKSSLPGEAPYRNPVIEAAAANPMFNANPAAAMHAIAGAVDPELQRRQSGINASAQAAAQQQRASTGDATKFYEIGSNAYKKILADTETNYDVKGLNLAIRKAEEIKSFANGKNPIANQGAMLEGVKAMYGGSRIAQQEINNFMAAQGITDRTEGWLNRVIDQGQLSRRQMNNLIELAWQIGENAKEARLQAAEAFNNSVMTDTDIAAAAPQWQKSWARSGQQRILGQADTGEGMEVPRLGGQSSGTTSTSTSHSARGAAAAPNIDGILQKHGEL